MKIYRKSNRPKAVEGENFSVDVIICDEDGFINLASFHYDMDKWIFHTDTLCDMTDSDFVWMYAPEELLNGLKKKNQVV